MMYLLAIPGGNGNDLRDEVTGRGFSVRIKDEGIFVTERSTLYRYPDDNYCRGYLRVNMSRLIPYQGV